MKNKFRKWIVVFLALVLCWHVYDQWKQYQDPPEIPDYYVSNVPMTYPKNKKYNKDINKYLSEEKLQKIIEEELDGYLVSKEVQGYCYNLKVRWAKYYFGFDEKYENAVLLTISVNTNEEISITKTTVTDSEFYKSVIENKRKVCIVYYPYNLMLLDETGNDYLIYPNNVGEENMSTKTRIWKHYDTLFD